MKETNKDILRNIELQSIDNRSSFIDGEGFIQQDPEVVELAKNIFIEEYKNFYVAGRTLSDSNSGFYRLWSRLCATDGFCREWGQIYYHNLRKDDSSDLHVCLNPDFRKYLQRKIKLENIDKL